MPAAVDLRLLRAAAFAAACVALAAAGHLLVAGPGMAPWTVAVGWLVLFAVCVPLAGVQRRSLSAVAGLLAAAQFGLHALFSLGHGPSGGLPAGGGHHGVTALAGKLLCNEQALHLSAGEAEEIIRNAGLPVPDAGAPAGAAAEVGAADAVAGLVGLGGPPMVAAHLVAALATGWLLLRGEAALWQLVRLSVRTVPDALRVALALARLLAGPGTATPAPARPPRPCGEPHPTTATSGTVLCDTVIRRGPPRPAVDALTLAA